MKIFEDPRYDPIRIAVLFALISASGFFVYTYGFKREQNKAQVYPENVESDSYYKEVFTFPSEAGSTTAEENWVEPEVVTPTPKPVAKKKAPTTTSSTGDTTSTTTTGTTTGTLDIGGTNTGGTGGDNISTTGTGGSMTSGSTSGTAPGGGTTSTTSADGGDGTTTADTTSTTSADGGDTSGGA